jgi:hypothetical protein
LKLRPIKISSKFLLAKLGWNFAGRSISTPMFYCFTLCCYHTFSIHKDVDDVAG